MSKRAALYLRVSTGEQRTDNQRLELEAVAAKSGWEIVEVYEDAGISGANGREKRPAFDRLLTDATKRKFDIVLSWSVDRLGRSLQHLVSFLDELHSLKIDLYLHQQGVDTTTPSGRALFQMMGVFSEFERSMIQSRVKAGLARAKAEGKKLGRPRIDAGKERAIAGAIRQGEKGLMRIAGEFGVGVSVVQRIKRESNIVEKRLENESQITRK